MRLAGLRPQVHALSLAGRGGVAARDELRLEAPDLGGAEDVRVGAELLDHLDRAGNPVRSRARETRAAARRTSSASRRRPRGRKLDETPPKETEPFAPTGISQRFIAGEPMKPATKVFTGRS